MVISRVGTLFLAIIVLIALEPGCDKRTKMLIGSGGSVGTSDSGLGGGAGGAGGVPDVASAGGSTEVWDVDSASDSSGSSEVGSAGAEAASSEVGSASDSLAPMDIGNSWDAGGQTTTDSLRCNGSALVGRWYRAKDSLIMILNADGCAITGTSDNASFSHTITGTYDDAARTMIGTIKRKTISSGCITLMNATWVLTDPTHYTFAITSTDGHCDLLTTYNEVSTFVRQ